MRLFLCCFLLSFLASCHAFAAPKASSSFASTKEAVEIFDANFPFNRPPPKKNKYANFGMPNYDIDGTKLSRDKPSSGKRFTDISEKDATASFVLLAQLYGEDRAFEMLKVRTLRMLCNCVFNPLLERFDND